VSSYHHTKDPDPAWQENLERLAPQGENVNWLKIHWFAGWDYEPVQRWRIFEMIHVREVDGKLNVPYEMLEDLKGLSPRHPDNGKWLREGFQVLDEESDGFDRWCSWSSVDFDQWTLFQETGCFPVPVWIIQGDKGGHRWRLSSSELGILKESGIEEPELPFPGELPYSDYNQLTFTKLAEFDRLRKWRMNTEWDSRLGPNHAGLWVRQERQEMEKDYNRALLKHLEDQMEAAVGDLPRSYLPGTADMPRGDYKYNKDEDAEDEAFVNDTATTLEV